MIYLLEITRGLAALWVFLFHVRPLFEQSSPFLYRFAADGHLGVPLFFVISGYVITHSAESSLRNKESPFIFLRKRFLRIYPVFWASVAVVLLTPYIIEAISLLKTGSYQFPEFVISRYTFQEWLNFLLLTKIFFSEAGDLQGQFNQINSVYWSLAIEFQFYLVICALLFFRRYYRSLLAIISLASILNLFYPLDTNPGLFINHWASFAAGVALAYLHKNQLHVETCLRNPKLALCALLAVLVILIFYFTRQDSRTFYFSFALISAAALWLLAPLESKLARIKNGGNKILSFTVEPFLILGTMSYSVYLLHGKIYLLPNMFVRQILPTDSLAYSVMTIVLTLLLCFPFYFYVERRFMSQKYTKIHNKVLTTVQPTQKPGQPSENCSSEDGLADLSSSGQKSCVDQKGAVGQDGPAG